MKYNHQLIHTATHAQPTLQPKYNSETPSHRGLIRWSLSAPYPFAPFPPTHQNPSLLLVCCFSSHLSFSPFLISSPKPHLYTMHSAVRSFRSAGRVAASASVSLKLPIPREKSGMGIMGENGCWRHIIDGHVLSRRRKRGRTRVQDNGCMEMRRRGWDRCAIGICADTFDRLDDLLLPLSTLPEPMPPPSQVSRYTTVVVLLLT